MHGAGNDYIYIDGFEETVPEKPEQWAVALSDRHFGVGGDGLVLILPSEKADARMRMFNADGSEAEMCGNAIRCVGKYLYDHGRCRKETLAIETGAGIKTLRLEILDEKVGRVRVDMGKPILIPAQVPTLLRGDGETDPAVEVPLSIGEREFRVSCVSMGNPHCVIFDADLTDETVHGFGPRIERDPRFPNRTNVEFVEVLSPSELRVRIWERGSGETQACGTGVCAVAVAGVLSGRSQRKVLVHVLGGDLEIEWSESDNHVYKTGPATEVFSGVYFGRG